MLFAEGGANMHEDRFGLPLSSDSASAVKAYVKALETPEGLVLHAQMSA